ncbi:MAG: oligosaccharide flippase family protein, partial [Clostridiales bacterium]|nr:oligosaccharide flippase family protein [Clostridiales bacterium]
FKEFISSILIFSIIVYLIITLGVNIFINNFGNTSIFIVNLMLIQSFSVYLVNYRSTEHNMNNEYKKYIALSFTTTISNIIVSVILMLTYFNNNKDIGRIMGSAISNIFLGLLIIIIILKQNNFKIELKKEYIIYALKLSLPMIPYTLSTILLNHFDRVLIQKYSGDAAVGTYSFIYNLGMILVILSTSLNNAWKPYVFKELNNNNYKNIRKNGHALLIGYTIISIMFLFVSPELQYILGSNKYKEGLSLLIPLVLSSFFVFAYNLIVFVEFYMKKLYISTIVTIILGVFNVILNMIFIPILGYFAATYVTLICYFTMFIWHYIYIKLYIKKNVMQFEFIGFSICLLSIFCIIFYYSINLIIVRYTVIVGMLITILLFIRNVRSKNEV